MIHIDRREFDTKCQEVISDVKEQELRSPTWGWIVGGAFLGFVASCIKFQRPQKKPIMASYTRMKGKTDGKSFG
jgi:hypothetical protein